MLVELSLYSKQENSGKLLKVKFWRTRSREKVSVVMSVHWYVEYIGVIIEGLLRRVTMVHVPVKNKDLLQFQSFFQELTRDGDRVEETKSPGIWKSLK